MSIYRFILSTSIAAVLVAGTATAQATTFNITNASTSAQTLVNGETGTVTSTGSITRNDSNSVITMSGSVTLNNSGTILQNGSGRVARNQTDGSTLTINNFSTGVIEAVGGDTFKISNLKLLLENYGQILNTANQAFDLADATSANSSVLNNHTGAMIKSTSGDAIKVGAGTTINNDGTLLAIPNIVSGNADSDYAINTDTRTGVIVNNTGSIKGRHGITGGLASVGTYTITISNTGSSAVIEAANGSGVNIDGVFTGVTASVTNGFGATIKGAVDNVSAVSDGDGVDVDGVLSNLTNSGDILGLGSKGGTNNAEAVAAGGGTIINNATGRIIGSSLAADAPNGDITHAGNGILIDDSNGSNAVAATTVTNSGLIQGKSGFGIRFIGTFADQISNNAGGTIRGAGTGAAIQTGDGGDTVTNSGTITGDNGAAIDLEAGNDTLNIMGNAAAITGSINGGTGTNTLNFDLTGANTFSYSGVISNFSTVEVKSGKTTLSGANAFVGTVKLTGGTLLLDGTNRLSTGNGLNLAGGTLELGSGGANAQTLASLILSNDSTLDLDDATSITFTSLAGFTAGKTLHVIDFSAAISPFYALRFSGNQTGNSTFLSFVSATTIDNQPAGISFDGTYTNLVPVPEPATIFGATLLLGFIGWRERRRLLPRGF